jgi:septal ring factor EnvC (AmiA/AmiB activator)
MQVAQLQSQLSCKASEAAGLTSNHCAGFFWHSIIKTSACFTFSSTQVAQLQAQLSCKASEAAGLTRKLAAVDPLTDALEAELRALQQGLTKVTARVQGQEAGLKGHEKRLLEMVQVRCCCSVVLRTWLAALSKLCVLLLSMLGCAALLLVRAALRWRRCAAAAVWRNLLRSAV